MDRAAGLKKQEPTAPSREKTAFFAVWLAPFLLSAFSDRWFSTPACRAIHYIGEHSTIGAISIIAAIIVLFVKSKNNNFIGFFLWVALVADFGFAFFKYEHIWYGAARHAIAGEETTLYYSLFWLPVFEFFSFTPSLNVLSWTDRLFSSGVAGAFFSAAIRLIFPIEPKAKTPPFSEKWKSFISGESRKSLAMLGLFVICVAFVLFKGFVEKFSNRAKPSAEAENEFVSALYKLEYSFVPDSDETKRAREMSGAGQTEEAIQLLTEASRAGDSTADAALGEMFEDGVVERDTARSAQFFLKGARRGNLAGLSGYSRIYRGIYRGKDKVELMEFTVQKGDRHQYNMQILGLYYMQGKTVKPDYLKSARYYMIAADEGSIEGAWQTAGFYYRGYLMERDLDKAEYWAGKVLRSSGTRNIFYRKQTELLLERIRRAKSSARHKTELLPDRRNRRGFALNHLFGHGSKLIK
jgi:hypothetical protein